MFFKKKIDKQSNSQLIKIAALMIHAGKIDENFSKQEEMIIKQALLKMGANTENIQEILEQSKIIEENANQILDFTKEVKVMDEEKKIEIIETLSLSINNDGFANGYTGFHYGFQATRKIFRSKICTNLRNFYGR